MVYCRELSNNKTYMNPKVRGAIHIVAQLFGLPIVAYFTHDVIAVAVWGALGAAFAYLDQSLSA